LRSSLSCFHASKWDRDSGLGREPLLPKASSRQQPNLGVGGVTRIVGDDDKMLDDVDDSDSERWFVPLRSRMWVMRNVSRSRGHREAGRGRCRASCSRQAFVFF
jgi:hypothetical protein